MVRTAALMVLTVLASCGPITDGQKADALAAEYDRIGTSTEQCRFAPAVADAYARAGKGEKVREWQHKQRMACLSKQMYESVGEYGK